MLTLGPDDILLDRHADDWQAALDIAAKALTDAGLVEAEYRDGLHAREAQSSTYLGNAIADSTRHAGKSPARKIYRRESTAVPQRHSVARRPDSLCFGDDSRAK